MNITENDDFRNNGTQGGIKSQQTGIFFGLVKSHREFSGTGGGIDQETQESGAEIKRRKIFLQAILDKYTVGNGGKVKTESITSGFFDTFGR